LINTSFLDANIGKLAGRGDSCSWNIAKGEKDGVKDFDVCEVVGSDEWKGGVKLWKEKLVGLVKLEDFANVLFAAIAKINQDPKSFILHEVNQIVLLMIKGKYLFH